MAGRHGDFRTAAEGAGSCRRGKKRAQPETQAAVQAALPDRAERAATGERGGAYPLPLYNLAGGRVASGSDRLSADPASNRWSADE
jgi:hypothetical protein